ncbi:Transposase [Oopsacas minuta]|uniref:Transposase n=1 Tax=Oopsacas minuta TaxID=111878 RepID=A0AAV7KC66_9METZ|nr:Transposase [Oopsacas minuta]
MTRRGYTIQHHISWVRGDEQQAKIPRPDFRKLKNMYTIFFSSHGIVLQLPCESGKAVIATFFTEQVLPNLIKNIEKYRPITGTRGMKILINNASSHTANLTKNFLDVEGLELLPHLAYSPDLAPCDFWLFPKLKIYLQGKDVNTLQALGTGLYQYFKSITDEEYRNVFYKWVKRSKLCASAGGDYFG